MLRRLAPFLVAAAVAMASIVALVARPATSTSQRRADYVIVAGAPVLDGPEVNLIEDSMAALLFSARGGVTSGRALKTAFEQVSPTEILGVALLGE